MLQSAARWHVPCSADTLGPGHILAGSEKEDSDRALLDFTPGWTQYARERVFSHELLRSSIKIGDAAVIECERALAQVRTYTTFTEYGKPNSHRQRGTQAVLLQARRALGSAQLAREMVICLGPIFTTSRTRRKRSVTLKTNALPEGSFARPHSVHMHTPRGTRTVPARTLKESSAAAPSAVVAASCPPCLRWGGKVEVAAGSRWTAPARVGVAPKVANPYRLGRAVVAEVVKMRFGKERQSSIF